MLINVLVANSLPDPPFVNFDWVTAEFSVSIKCDYHIRLTYSGCFRLQFEGYTNMNGTMNINTTAIQTDTRCAVPNQLSATASNTGDLTVTATSVEGCALALAVNPNNAAEQYGVVNVPNCGSNSTDPAFQPVRQSITFLQGGGVIHPV